MFKMTIQLNMLTIYITYNNNSSYKKQKSIEKNIRIYTFNYI